MNISGLNRASARLTSAFKRICGRSTQKLGLRLLAKCERRERRVREEIASIEADRKRAYRLIGGRGR